MTHIILLSLISWIIVAVLLALVVGRMLSMFRAAKR
jgi:hypothetical protein